MYKPHTIEQYKVYRFLEENFALEHFLLAPLSRFGLMLDPAHITMFTGFARCFLT